MDDETRHIALAAAALGDRHADERLLLEEILRTEPDLTRRREAERRYLAVTEPKDEAA